MGFYDPMIFCVKFSVSFCIKFNSKYILKSLYSDNIPQTLIPVGTLSSKTVYIRDIERVTFAG